MRNKYPTPRWWRACRRRGHRICIESRRDVYVVIYLCRDCAYMECVWHTQHRPAHDLA
jgi:hypothetical protein